MITVFRRGFNIHFSRVFFSSNKINILNELSYKSEDLYDNSFRRSAEIKDANNLMFAQHENNNKIYDIESDPSYYESKKYKMNTNTHTNYNINDTTYKTGKMIE